MQLPRRQLKKHTKEKLRPSDGISAAKIAALATMVAAGLTLLSGTLSTRQAREQSCIARIDSQESKLREKAADLLGGLGEMIAVASQTDQDRSRYNTAIQRVMKQSYELTAYTGPTVFGLQALKIAQAAQRGYSVVTEKDRTEAIKKNGTTFYDWPLLYSDVLEAYERQRKDCSNWFFSSSTNQPAQTPTAPAP